MANKYMRRESPRFCGEEVASSVIREPRIKTAEVPLHPPLRGLESKSQIIASADKDVGKSDPSSTAGGNTIWGSCFGKQSGRPSKD